MRLSSRVPLKNLRSGCLFTKAVNSYQQAFSRIDPSATFTWNNIVKIGITHAKGLPSETNLQWQDHWFDVIREEFCILAPDVVLFFTGPRYDRFLKRVFGDVTFNKSGTGRSANSPE